MATFYPGKCVVVTAVCLFPALFLFAQKKYSLQDLVDASNKNLPVLKQKQALVAAAKASVNETKHSFLPQVRASEQLTLASDNSLAGSFFTFGITPSTSAGVRNENRWNAATTNMGVVYSEYELLNFGLNDAKLQYAKSFVDVQESDLKKELYFLQLEVARLYFSVLKNQYRLEADRQNIQRYEQIYSVIRALTLSGLKPGSDSSLTKAELSRTKIIFNQSMGRMGQLKEQLSYLTGIPAAEIQLDTLQGNPMDRKPVWYDYRMDTLHNPLLDYFVAKTKMLQANAFLIRKSYLPKIILAGSVWARGSSIQFNDQYKSLSTGLGFQRFNYGLGVAFTYNLFNGMYRRDKLAVNRYQLQASEFELEQQKSALRLNELQANNALATVRANLAELPVQLQSAKETYAQKLAQYRAGIISLVDLTNASFVLYRSQTDYIETLSDWNLSQLEKAAATGNLSQFIQTIK
ncbi:TolC family protein [Sediminibacterium roseum]|uniref:TolC family protein n=1 Tax=Sediminibacterium roseum TaxID=1978412 RepID=A0ABX0A3P4_9BACT|nr:TolC family protein [Sediminibacterium roseum]NCI52043.1 TolC family protein [Sediminibacterium roseum]